MAIRTITTTVNSSTGAITNTVDGLTATDTVSGVALRDQLASGVDSSEGTASLNPADTSATLTLAPQGPIPGSVVISDENGTEYTVTGVVANVASFTPAVPGGTANAVATYRYHAVGDIVYDIKVRPTNVTAVITASNVDVILLKNGPKGGFSQKFTPGVTSATVNDVVAAILTE